MSAAPLALNLTDASDSGSSNTDNITNVAAGIYSGTAEANSTVQIFDTGGFEVLSHDAAAQTADFSTASVSHSPAWMCPHPP